MHVRLCACVFYLYAYILLYPQYENLRQRTWDNYAQRVEYAKRQLCRMTIMSNNCYAKRHLLIVIINSLTLAHRRQAILDEVQRLRVEGCIRPPGAPTEKGRLTVKDIILPLKQDYIRKLASDAISGHHLVCLLKYNETVLATQSVPTLPGLLSVRFPDVLQLSNVYADFKVGVI